MPPKNFQLTFAWTLLATILMGAAVWQAQVTTLKEAAAKHAPLPPPPKTRHAIRPHATSFSRNVVEDYISRCEKGMTDQQIGWIIDDFRNAELDQNWRDPEISKSRFRQLIGNQQRWYIDSLKDGLRLDSAQVHEARENLSKLFSIAADAFLSGQKHEVLSDPENHFDFEWILGNPAVFNPNDALMPWKLCSLSPEQERITWKKWHQSFSDKFWYAGGPSAQAQSELTNGPLFRFNHPGMMFHEEHPIPPSWARCANWVLPIMDQQRLISPSSEESLSGEPANKETLLGNIRRLHSAQFRIVLLFAPEMAASVRTALASKPVK